MTDVLANRPRPGARTPSSPPSRRPARSPRRRGKRSGSRRASCGELFEGSFRLDLVHPFPQPEPGRPGARPAVHGAARALHARAGGQRRDRPRGQDPAGRSSRASRELGAFGIKIPKEYGGLGPQPVQLHPRHRRWSPARTATSPPCSPPPSRSACRSRSSSSARPEQKKKYLPRLAKGAVSAFALTETRWAPIPRRSAPPPSSRPTASTTSSTAKSSGAPTAPSPS